VIQTDDTPVRAQDSATGAMRTGRLWDYLGDCDHRFIVYDYTPDRSSEGPERILAGFRSGYLQSDAYQAYDRIHARGIIEVSCMAHARRKFDEAKTSDQERAHAGLAWIGRLYQIERQAKDEIGEAIERLRFGLTQVPRRRLEVQGTYAAGRLRLARRTASSPVRGGLVGAVLGLALGAGVPIGLLRTKIEPLLWVGP